MPVFGMRKTIGARAALARMVLILGLAAGGPVAAEESSPDFSDALIELFARAQDGSGDPHLPYVLNDLKKALAGQNLQAFLELVEPAYFTEQFALIHKPGRTPGDSIGQFACEFFQICDISKSYGYSDIVSGNVTSVREAPGLPSGRIEIRLELRMWDGLTLPAVIFYDPASAKLSSSRG